jgi:hypothetical protein
MICRRLRSGGLWFQASPDKKVWKTPSKLEKKLARVVHAYYPSDDGKHEIKVLWSTLAWAKKVRPYL